MDYLAAIRNPTALFALLVLGCGSSDLLSGNEGFATSSAATTGSGGSVAQGTGGMTTTSAGGTIAPAGVGGSTTNSTNNSSSGTGGTPFQGMKDEPCDWQGAPCAAGLYCLAPGCKTGTCQPLGGPSSTPPPLQPVCGCDGITYFDASTAAQAGQSLAYSEGCKVNEATACSEQTPCPAGTYCSRRVGNAGGCFMADKGTCWALPSDCSEGAKIKGRQCFSPGIQCKGFCELLKEQKGYYIDSFCF